MEQHLSNIVKACQNIDRESLDVVMPNIQALIDSISDKDTLNDVLCWVAGEGPLEVLKRVVESSPSGLKADLAAHDSQAIRMAAKKGMLDNLCYLVEEAPQIAGTKPDLMAQGGSVLICAADWGFLAAVRYLVEDACRILGQPFTRNALVGAHCMSTHLQDEAVSDYLARVLEDCTPTREEVEDLKRQWLDDGTWDIYDIEGFEAYEKELRVFQEETEREWEAKRDAEDQARAKKWGMSVELLRKVDSLEARMANSVASAKSHLVHYFDLTGAAKSGDNRIEIESIVSNIVEAAVAGSTAAILKELKKQ